MQTPDSDLRSDFGRGFDGRRVLVTGASGFLGRHLCRALEGLGAELHAAVRNPDRLDRRRRYQQVWTLDVRDYAQMRWVVASVKPDVVFHLAGFSSARPDRDLVLPMLEHNLLGTVHALLAVAEAGCERIVMVCSAEEIRDSASSDAVMSPYGASKMAATIYARFFEQIYDVPVALTRPLMAYGPGQDPAKLIPYAITSFLRSEPPRLSSGSRLCDFVYVDDVVRGFLMAATRQAPRGRVLEFGSGHARSTREVVERIARLAGANVAPVYGALPDRPEAPMHPADIEAAERLIGWTPRWSLDEGLSTTIAYYRDRGAGVPANIAI